RGEFDRAEELYKRCLELDPTHANGLANYAGLLLGRGKMLDGVNVHQRAVCARRTAESTAVEIEVAFYGYMHLPPERQKDLLERVRSLVDAGARSIGWDFALNIRAARSENHPAGEWLQKLADVITKGTDIATLSDWDDWNHAAGDNILLRKNEER